MTEQNCDLGLSVQIESGYADPCVGAATAAGIVNAISDRSQPNDLFLGMKVAHLWWLEY
jgi:hypothetical protein